LGSQETQAYAESLTDIVNRLSSDYVRPIPRHQLFFAALSGLYEAAGLPVPEKLQTDLARRIKDLPAPAQVPADPQEAERQREDLFRQAVDLAAAIRQKLGDREELKRQAGLRVSIEALLRLLDPYSMLVDSRELRRSAGEESQCGFGIEIDPGDVTGPLRIKAVLLGGPAQRGGLRPGDRITHIDGKKVAEDNRAMLSLPFASPPPLATLGGRKIELKVLPQGQKPAQRIKLDPETFKPETVLGARRDGDECWDYLLDRERRIGYARIVSLDFGTADALQQAVSRLQRDHMTGLILDLRWCPGGFLSEAVLITRLFLKEGTIATIQSRKYQDNQAYSTDGGSSYLGDFPLVVLINGETSGGAELIAAALQDHKRAAVAGQRSLGKASVQTMLPLPLDNLGLKLTTGNFIRPSGKALHRFPDSQPKDDWGVRPELDLNLPVTADLSQQLRDWYQDFSLRPGRSNKVLPMDDPENDPQRQMALEALRKMLN
jgi:carboxyl-terminal processing protease